MTTALDMTALLQQLTKSGELMGRVPAAQLGDDELGQLGKALNAFLDKMWLKDFQISAQQQMLERQVEMRTREVNEILDHVAYGFLIADRDGVVQPGFTRSCASIFGTDDIQGAKLTSLMGLDERKTGHFDVMYEQVYDDYFPADVAVAMLPPEFDVDGQTYRISGSLLRNAHGDVGRVFFSITNVTRLKEVEAQNLRNSSLLEILKNRDSFVRFVSETQAQLDKARDNLGTPVVRDVLHTIKGNAGVFGLEELAELVHEIEDHVAIDGLDIEHVDHAIRGYLDTNYDVLRVKFDHLNDRTVQVPEERIRAFLAEIRDVSSASELRSRVNDFLYRATFVKAESLLGAIPGLVERLGARLGKEVELVITGGDVAVDPRRAYPVVHALVHAVRNAMDHGIEPADERGDKPAVGTLEVAFTETADAWTVSVRDDGRGVDLDRVRARAVDRGVLDARAAVSDDDALELIFADQLSTRTAADGTSGRGVGMGALRAAAANARGRVDVRSARGKGTTVTVTVPRVATTAPEEQQSAA